MSIPLPVLANVFRMTLVWDNAGIARIPVNVIHIKSASSSSTSTDAYNILAANVTAAMWAASWTGMGIGHVNVIPLDGVTGTTTFATGGGAKWQGSGTGGFIPQVAALVKIQTGLRGRNARGRVFIPGVDESNVSGGTITGSIVTSMTSAWNAFAGFLRAATPSWDFGVASYDRAGSPPAPAFTPYSVLSVEPLAATQRRRQPR